MASRSGAIEGSGCAGRRMFGAAPDCPGERVMGVSLPVPAITYSPIPDVADFATITNSPSAH